MVTIYIYIYIARCMHEDLSVHLLMLQSKLAGRPTYLYVK